MIVQMVATTTIIGHLLNGSSNIYLVADLAAGFPAGFPAGFEPVFCASVCTCFGG